MIITLNSISLSIIINKCIIKNFNFRDKPPGQTCQKTVEELTEITQNVVKGDMALEYVNLLKGVKIISDEHINMISDLTRLKSEIDSFSSDNILAYEGQLKDIFHVKFLGKKRDNLKYLLSYKSMSLYPEYRSRLLVLRKLKYIDSNNSGTELVVTRPGNFE